MADLKALKMFADLAKTLHFGKTAEANHVSTSTLSRIIQRLEQEMGCPLFHRDNRHVVLNQAGQQVFAFAEKHLEEWQQLKNALQDNNTELTGKLRLYCSVTASYSHLPKILEKFRQQHPQVEIELTTGDASDAFEQLQQDTVDIAIAVKPEALPRFFHFQHLTYVPLYIIGPTISCPLQQHLQHEPFTWAQVPMILPEHGVARKRFDYWYRKKQQGKPNIYATVAGNEALVSMVALGFGVGISPQVVVENSPVKERVQYLRNVGDIPPFDLGICCLNQHKVQPLVKAFFDAVD